MKNEQNNSSELKIGSVIATQEFCPIKKESVFVERKITRTSDTYIWFNGSGYERIKRTTIDNYPSLYKIVTI